MPLTVTGMLISAEPKESVPLTVAVQPLSPFWNMRSSSTCSILPSVSKLLFHEPSEIHSVLLVIAYTEKLPSVSTPIFTVMPFFALT